MKVSPALSHRILGLAGVSSALLLTCPAFGASASTDATPPPQVPEYPETCDTTALPTGFKFPELSAQLPFDLGSLKKDPNDGLLVRSIGDSECDVFETQKQFDLFSWATFIALNWPADDNGNPLPGDFNSSPTAYRVWEHYISPTQIFKKGGTKPDPWGQPEFGGRRVLSAISKNTQILNEVDEAFFNNETPLPPITDLNNAYVRYEIRLNQPEYDYIVKHTLYNVEGQKAYEKAISFPSGTMPVEGKSPGKVGAIELKVAWKEMGPGDDKKLFYTIEPEVVEPFGPKKTVTGKTYGLVGMHIMVRTQSAPEWVWATFEHVDNAPRIDLRDPLPDKFTAQGHYNFWNADGSHSFGGFDPNVYATLLKMRTPKNKVGDYYQAESERAPSQITQVITANNAVATSQWTNHLNSVMQQKLKGSVFANYRLISTQWPVNPGTLPAGNPAPVSLGNPVMETYMQVNGSCMGCHAGATYDGTQDKSLANFSFMLQRAQSTSSTKN